MEGERRAQTHGTFKLWPYIQNSGSDTRAGKWMNRGARRKRQRFYAQEMGTVSCHLPFGIS